MACCSRSSNSSSSVDIRRSVQYRTAPQLACPSLALPAPPAIPCLPSHRSHFFLCIHPWPCLTSPFSSPVPVGHTLSSVPCTLAFPSAGGLSPSRLTLPLCLSPTPHHQPHTPCMHPYIHTHYMCSSPAHPWPASDYLHVRPLWACFSAWLSRSPNRYFLINVLKAFHMHIHHHT